LKKQAGSVRFRFYKQKTEKNRKKPSQTGKTEPNRKKPSQNRKKPSQNRKNRVKPVWTGFCPKKPNRTEPKPVGLTRFRFGFGIFFQKKIISVWLLFFDKNRTELKMITPSSHRINEFHCIKPIIFFLVILKYHYFYSFKPRNWKKNIRVQHILGCKQIYCI